MRHARRHMPAMRGALGARPSALLLLSSVLVVALVCSATPAWAQQQPQDAQSAILLETDSAQHARTGGVPTGVSQQPAKPAATTTKPAASKEDDRIDLPLTTSDKAAIAAMSAERSRAAQVRGTLDEIRALAAEMDRDKDVEADLAVQDWVEKTKFETTAKDVERRKREAEQRGKEEATKLAEQQAKAKEAQAKKDEAEAKAAKAREEAEKRLKAAELAQKEVAAKAAAEQKDKAQKEADAKAEQKAKEVKAKAEAAARQKEVDALKVQRPDPPQVAAATAAVTAVLAQDAKLNPPAANGTSAQWLDYAAKTAAAINDAKKAVDASPAAEAAANAELANAKDRLTTAQKSGDKDMVAAATIGYDLAGQMVNRTKNNTLAAQKLYEARVQANKMAVTSAEQADKAAVRQKELDTKSAVLKAELDTKAAARQAELNQKEGTVKQEQSAKAAASAARLGRVNPPTIATLGTPARHLANAVHTLEFSAGFNEWAANQQVSFADSYERGSNYIRVESKQGSSTPGLIINNGVLKPNTAYSIRLVGMLDADNSVAARVCPWVDYKGNNLVWTCGDATSLVADNERAIVMNFTSVNYDSGYRFGALFSSPAAGDAFFLKSLSIFERTGSGATVFSAGVSRWVPNQSVGISLVRTNGYQSVRVMSNQATSTPGIRMNSVALYPNTAYRIAMIGHVERDGFFACPWVSHPSVGNILWNCNKATSLGMTTMVITADFKTPAASVDYSVGVLFSGMQQTDVFELRALYIEKASQVSVVELGVPSYYFNNQPNRLEFAAGFQDWQVNQNVQLQRVRFAGSNYMAVRSLQATSTPGTLLQTMKLQANTEYTLTLSGRLPDGAGNYFACPWADNPKGNVLWNCKSDTSLLRTDRTIRVTFKTTTERMHRVGVLFTGMSVGDMLYIKSFDISRVTPAKSAPVVFAGVNAWQANGAVSIANAAADGANPVLLTSTADSKVTVGAFVNDVVLVPGLTYRLVAIARKTDAFTGLVCPGLRLADGTFFTGIKCDQATSFGPAATSVAYQFVAPNAEPALFQAGIWFQAPVAAKAAVQVFAIYIETASTVPPPPKPFVPAVGAVQELSLNKESFGPYRRSYRVPQVRAVGNLCFASGLARTIAVRNSLASLPDACLPLRPFYTTTIASGVQPLLVDVMGKSLTVSGGAASAGWLTLDGLFYPSAASKPTVLPLAVNTAKWTPKSDSAPGLLMQGDVCVLMGTVTLTNPNAFDATIATLPMHCAPPLRLVFLVGGPIMHRVDVLPDGQVQWVSGSNRASPINLNRIAFNPQTGTAVTLAGSYTPYAQGYRGPMYHMLGPVCFVSGLIKGTGTSLITTLPAACRPASGRLVFFTASSHGSGVARVDVLPDGRVVWVTNLLAGWISLNGIVVNTAATQTFESQAAVASWSGVSSTPKALPVQYHYAPYVVGYRSPQWVTVGSFCVLTGLYRTVDMNGRSATFPNAVANVAFTLPEVCRPSARIILDVHNAADQSIRLDITANGQATWTEGAVGYWMSVSGIMFPIANTAVTALKLANGWTNYGAGYAAASYQLVGNVCTLSGLILAPNGKKFADVAQIATLPIGCTPTGRLIFNVNQGSNTHRVDVLPTGQVVWVGGTATQQWLPLDGISFPVEFVTNLKLAGKFEPYAGSYRHPGYFKQGALCMLSGLLKNNASEALITTLPAECRPASGRLVFHLTRSAGGARVDVLPDGTVTHTTPAAGWLSLDGIRFTVGPMQEWEDFVAKAGAISEPRNAQPMAIILSNGYSPYMDGYNIPAYSRIGMYCSLAGLIKSRAGTIVGQLAEVAASCRPTARLIFQTFVNNEPTRIDLLPSGQLLYVEGGQNANWLSLDGLIYTSQAAVVAPNADISSTAFAYGPTYRPDQSKPQAYSPPTITRDGDLCVFSGYLERTGAKFEALVGFVPAECVPEDGRMIFYVSNGKKPHRIDVEATGRVTWVSGDLDKNFISLDGISYFNAKPTALTLGKGWAAYASGYRLPSIRKEGNLCVLSGLANGQGETIATLPVECRPEMRMVFFTINGQGRVTRVDALPDGRLIVVSGPTGASWLSLSGMSLTLGRKDVQMLHIPTQTVLPVKNAQQVVDTARQGQQVWLDRNYAFATAPAGILDKTQYIFGNLEVRRAAVCPVEGGARFKLDKDSVGYVCCNAGAKPTLPGWTPLPGSWPLVNLAGTPCTYYRGFIDANVDTTVCCDKSWATGVFVSDEKPMDAAFWTKVDGDMASFSVVTDPVYTGFSTSVKIDSVSKAGVTIYRPFGPDVDGVNFRFTIYYYDNAKSDSRNDWVALNVGTSQTSWDYVLGVYNDQTHYSNYPPWAPTRVVRSVGWHKYEFIGTPGGVNAYVDGVLTFQHPFKGVVKGMAIRGNVKSTAVWSPYRMTRVEAVTKVTVLGKGSSVITHAGTDTLVWPDRTYQFTTAPPLVFDTQYVSGNLEVKNQAACPKEGGASFRVDRDTMAYVCCNGNAKPTDPTFRPLPGNYALKNLAGTPCTFYGGVVFGGKDTTICCTDSWATGVFISDQQPHDPLFWKIVDGNRQALSVATDRVYGGFANSLKIDSINVPAGITIVQALPKDTDGYNFRFTVYFYDDSTNDQRNDWVGIGSSEANYADHVLGVYSDKTHYSFHPSWTASKQNRAVGWHKYEFVGNGAVVKYFIDDVYIRSRPATAPITHMSIRGNMKSTAWWSPFKVVAVPVLAPAVVIADTMRVVRSKQVASDVMKHTGEYSAMLWLKVFGVDDEWVNILHKGDADGNRPPALWLYPGSSRLHVRSCTASDWNAGASPDPPELPLHTWVHVAWTHTDGRVIVYYNGKVVSDYQGAAPPLYKAGPLYLSSPWNKPAPVVVADLRFVAGAVMPQQIEAVMNEKKYKQDFQPAPSILVPSNRKPAANTVLYGANAVPDSYTRTYMFWVFPQDTNPNWSNIFHRGSTDGTRDPAVWFYPNSFQLHIRTGTANDANNGNDVPDQLPRNQWTHVAFVHYHNKFQIYFNGQLKRDAAMPVPLVRNGPIYFSNPWYPAAAAVVSDLRFYDLPLNAEEITFVMNQKLFQPVAVTRTLKADTFRPAQGQVIVSENLVHNGELSLSFWIKPMGIDPNWNNVLHKGQSDSNRGPAVWFYPGTTQLHCRSGTSASWNDGASPDPPALPMFQWTHVAFTHVNNKFIVWYNGNIVSSSQRPPPVNQPGPFYASNPWYNPAACLLADIRWAASEITTADVQKIMSEKQYQPNLLPPQVLLKEWNTNPAQGVVIAQDGQLPRSVSFTYTFWIMPYGTNPGWSNILHKGRNDNERGPGIWMFPGDTRLHCRSGTPASWNDGADTRALPMHTFTHVAFVHYGGTITVYFNGAVVLNEGHQGPTLNPGPLMLSNPWYPAAPCSVSDLRYFSVALSADDVGRIYAEKKFRPETDMFMLREGTWVPKQGAEITGANADIKHSGVYSMSFWIKPMGRDSQWTNIIHHGNGDNVRAPAIFIFPGDTRLHCRSGSTASWNDGLDTPALPIFAWTHVTIIHHSGWMGVYFNGKLVVQGALQLPVYQPGKLYSGNPWYRRGNCLMADFRWAPRVLTPGEIAAMVKEARYDKAVLPPHLVIRPNNFNPVQNVAIAQADAFYPSVSRSFTFWIRVHGINAGWSNVFHKGRVDGERGPALFIYPGSSRLHMRSGTAGNWNDGDDPGQILAINQWTHVAWVHYHGTFQVYFNGNLVMNRGMGEPTANSGLLYGSNPWYPPAAATLSDLRYFDLALNQEMVQNIISQRRFAPVDLGLALRSGTFRPSQGQAIHGGDLQHQGAYSMMFWVKPCGISAGWANLLHKGSVDSQRGPGIWMYPQGTRLHVRSSSPSGWNDGANPDPPALPMFKWTHVAVSHQEGLMIVWYDGRVVMRTGIRGPIFQPGAMWNSNPWYPAGNSLMADVRWTPAFLSDAEVAEVIRAGRVDQNAIPPFVQLIGSGNYAPAQGRVLANANQIPGSEGYAFTFWVKPTGTMGSWSNLFHKGRNDNERSPGVWFHPGRTALHCRSATPENWNNGIDTRDLPMNAWTHVAVVHHYARIAVYFNGGLAHEARINQPVNNPGVFYGSNPWYPAARCLMTDLRYFPMPLAPDHINTIFRQNLHGA